MAQLVLAAAGAVVGNAMGWGMLGMSGASVGWMAGTALGGLLFPPKLPDGPRLEDLSVQLSAYGQPITRLWGTSRIAGNVIWATDLVEHEHEEGGKGGSSYSTYSYTCSFAVSLCEGPITGVRRIWADGKLIYDVRPENEGEQKDFVAASYTEYVGTEDQLEDPTMQAALTNTPAYRGQAYVVFADLELAKYGNRIPNLTFEVVHGILGARVPSLIVPSTEDFLADAMVRPDVDPNTGYIWAGGLGPVDPVRGYRLGAVTVYDPINKRVVKNIRTSRGKDSYLQTNFDAIVVDDGMTTAWGGSEWFSITYGGSGAANSLIWNAPVGFICGPPPYGFNGSWSGAIGWLTQRSYVPFDPILAAYSVGGGYVVKGGPSCQPRGDGWAELVGVSDTKEYGILHNAKRIGVDGFSYIVTARVNKVGMVKESFAPIRYWGSFSQHPLDYEPGAQIYGELRDVASWIAYDDRRRRILVATQETGYSTVWARDSYWLTVGEITPDVVPDPPVTYRTFGLEMPPQSIGSARGIYFHEQADKLLVGWSLTSCFSVYNGDTLALEYTGPIDPEAGVFDQSFHFTEIDGQPDRAYVVSTDGLYRLWLGPQITPEPCPLAVIVTDLSLEVGLTEGQIDVTELTDDVLGFVLARQGTARTAIETLMMAYQFDAVESAGKIKYVKRGKPPSVTIDAADLAVHPAGQDTPTALALARADEIGLPQNIAIKYVNVANDYQIGTQSAQRQTGRAEGAVTLDLAVVLDDSTAKGLAENALYAAWVARTSAKWTTSLKHAKVEPTDVVSISGNPIRVTKRTLDQGVLSFEGTMDSGTFLTSGAVAVPSYPVDQVLPNYSNTRLLLLDVPLLLDVDDNTGFYLAASGYTAAWPGGELWRSNDGGVTWAVVMTFTTAISNGEALGALGDFTQNMVDQFNTVAVVMWVGTLSSVTEFDLMAGANAAILGNEIIQFKTATLNPDGSYTLSGLLRGRKGSPTTGHAAGERFVLLGWIAMRRLTPPSAEIGLVRHYKAPRLGQSVESASTIAFTNTAQGSECLSPVLLGGGRDASGNLTVTWVRRTRTGGEWRDYVDAGLGESSESYEVEVWSSGYATLKRTLTSTTQSVSYTAAQQTTDFGSTQATVYLRVYQLSAAMGRGNPLQGSI